MVACWPSEMGASETPATEEAVQFPIDEPEDEEIEDACEDDPDARGKYERDEQYL